MAAEVHDITRAEVRSTGAMLARAFDDNPSFTHILPGARRRALTLKSGFREMAHDALHHGNGFVAADGSRVLGAALWMPPGSFPFGFSRKFRQAVAFLGVGLLHAPRLLDGMRMLQAVQRVHPREKHWYLAVLGTEPAVQGTGVGTSVIRAGIRAADAEGLGCYLETDTEENVSWYRRHGFEPVDELRPVTGGPTIWTMWRDPDEAGGG